MAALADILGPWLGYLFWLLYGLYLVLVAACGFLSLTLPDALKWNGVAASLQAPAPSCSNPEMAGVT